MSNRSPRKFLKMFFKLKAILVICALLPKIMFSLNVRLRLQKDEILALLLSSQNYKKKKNLKKQFVCMHLRQLIFQGLSSCNLVHFCLPHKNRKPNPIRRQNKMGQEWLCQDWLRKTEIAFAGQSFSACSLINCPLHPKKIQCIWLGCSLFSPSLSLTYPLFSS